MATSSTVQLGSNIDFSSNKSTWLRDDSSYSTCETTTLQGYSGYSGSGVSGYSGYSGTSGYSGFSGGKYFNNSSSRKPAISSMGNTVKR